jgi:hypothetical protein
VSRRDAIIDRIAAGKRELLGDRPNFNADASRKAISQNKNGRARGFKELAKIERALNARLDGSYYEEEVYDEGGDDDDWLYYH